MRIKRVLIICLLILISTSIAFALTYTSPNYVLKEAKIVVSSGKAASFNYSLEDTKIGSYIGGKAQSFNYVLDASNLVKRLPQILSIFVSPNVWDIGQIPVDSTIAMSEQEKIFAINNGTIDETFSLRVVNPPRWQADNTPAQERFTLSALFSAVDSPAPDESDFNQANLEDVIGILDKAATDSVFGYNAEASNGRAVPKQASRALYIQFKSPTQTEVIDRQDISVIISCEVAQ